MQHQGSANSSVEKLTTSKLAKHLSISTRDLGKKLIAVGLLELNGEEQKLTAKGTELGGEMKSGRYGDYFLWPQSLNL